MHVYICKSEKCRIRTEHLLALQNGLTGFMNIQSSDLLQETLLAPHGFCSMCNSDYMYTNVFNSFHHCPLNMVTEIVAVSVVVCERSSK